MTSINILHFSDVHWHPTNHDSQVIIRDAMMNDIKELRQAGITFDIAIFTGDLVRGGEDQEHFDEAHEEILAPIVQAAGLTVDELFICPGNHDISRRSVRDSDFIESGLKERLISTEAANALLKRHQDGDQTASIAFARMDNYNRYVSKFYAPPEFSSKSVNIFKREIRGLSVGIASFDNSWRATGEPGGVDRNQLIMGERNVDFAIDKTRDAELAIAIFHHPTSWLTEFDASSISARLQQKFDLLAFGHVHSSEPEAKTTVNGSSIAIQSGSFYAGRSHYNGYQVIAIDHKVCRAEVKLRTYFDEPGRRFGPAENIVARGEASFTYRSSRSKSSPELELVLREIRPEIRRMALEQFNISDLGQQICSDPHTAFICPPIFLEVAPKEEPTNDEPSQDDSTEESQLDVHSSSDEQTEIDAQHILSSGKNFILVGDREAGKTSLAHYLAVLTSEGACGDSKIPIVFDFNEFKGNLYSLKKVVASYLGTLKAGLNTENLLRSGNFLFVVDNYSGTNEKNRDGLVRLIADFPENRWILLTDRQHGTLRKDMEEKEIIPGIEVAQIQKLPRRSIRAITQRWCERSGADSEETFSTVMEQIRSSDLPRTGYIVTLLLWALHQNKMMERINEAVLIMNMADYLLGKADFRSALEGEFDATSKEITLQSLAAFLKENGGLVEPNEATHFLIEFFRQKGLAYDAGKVLSTLVDCGLLFQNKGCVRFKYRCFQEYFHANHLKSSSTRLRASYINRSYLNNIREIEILSGLARENDEIIDELMFQIRNYSPESISDMSLEKFDDLIEAESSVGISRKKLQTIRRTKLTPNQIDDLMDAAESQLTSGPKKNSDPAEDSSTSQKKQKQKGDLESNVPEGEDLADVLSAPKLKIVPFLNTLSLLGKVLRNSEFTSRERKITGIRVYGQSSARFFLLTCDVVSEVFSQLVEAMNKEKSTLDDEAIRGLHYFLTKKMMLFVQGLMSSDLASSKLTAVMDEILSAPDISAAERTFLVALQLDGRNPNWDKHWQEHASNFKTHRISTEFLAEKLWSHIHSKVLTTKEQNKVETTAAELEIALGGSRSARGRIIENIRSSKYKSNFGDRE